jgi:hypothetical protein
MSTIQLPNRENPVKATRIGPGIAIYYSLPKVGKTGQLVELAKMEDTLIIDAEKGTETYDTTAVKVDSIQMIYDIIDAIKVEGGKRVAAGKKGIDVFPYKFLALDTLDKIEELAESHATKVYKSTVIGKNFKGDSVLELPQGGGYYYLRNVITDLIDALSKVCPYLILIVHVKEKIMLDKANQEVKVNDISLTGKLSSIVCAKADCISYLYRNNKGEMRMSFQTYDGAVMGARQRYLAGQDFPFSWQTIYPDVFPPSSTAE